MDETHMDENGCWSLLEMQLEVRSSMHVSGVTTKAGEA